MALEIHLHSPGSADVLSADLIQAWIDDYAEGWFAESEDHCAEVWIDGIRLLDEDVNSIDDLRDLIERSRVASFWRSTEMGGEKA